MDIEAVDTDLQVLSLPPNINSIPTEYDDQMYPDVSQGQMSVRNVAARVPEAVAIENNQSIVVPPEVIELL